MSGRSEPTGVPAAPREVEVSYLDAASWDAGMLERLRWLREHDPVRWSGKDGLWLVTRYRDIEWISRHQDPFTSAQGVRPGNSAKIGLIDEGEPHHGQLRKLLNRGFTPRMAARLEQKFREIVDEALDEMAAQDECDFVETVSVPLPLLIIAEMIGIRREDRPRFHDWSDRMITADGNLDRPEIMHSAATAFVEYSQYLSEIIEDRRRHPQDDLVSILVSAKDEGVIGEFEGAEGPVALGEEHARLGNDELIKLLVILMVAGNETTRNAISGGMQLLIENPDERRKLLDDPALLPSAVEEMVRLVSPVQSFSRTATAEVELRDRRIEAGQQVLLLYPSANRDAEVFDDPDRFRVERNPTHLGFGIGSHFCLGANLARMEMRVAFEQLLRRFPELEYAGEGPVMKPSALVRSCVEMRVRPGRVRGA